MELHLSWEIDQVTDRRLRIVKVSPDLLFNLNFPNTPIVKDGVIKACEFETPIPEDLTIVRIRYEVDWRTFDFLVWSSTFDVVPECQVIPNWPVTMRERRFRVLDSQVEPDEPFVVEQ